MLRKLSILAILLLPCLAQSITPAAEESVLLLVPSRQLTVRCSFDIARIRPVQLVSYTTPRKRSADPDLFVWRNDERRWEQISVEVYRGGEFLDKEPSHVLLFGTDRYLRAALLEASARRWKTERIPSMNLGDLVNGMDRMFRFSPSEWRWLARRNGLELKDRNEQRRRYGRYGPPGTKPTPPPKPAVEPAAAPAPEPEIEGPVVPAPRPRMDGILELVPEPGPAVEPEAQPMVEPEAQPVPEPKPPVMPEPEPQLEVEPEPTSPPEPEPEPGPEEVSADRKWQELPQVEDLEDTMPRGVKSVGDSIRRELDPVPPQDK